MDEISTLDPQETSLIWSEFERAFGESVVEVSPLRQHASERRLFRVIGQFSSAIAVFNPSRAENDTFSYLTNHFSGLGLPVPQIYSYLPERGFLLEADLGDTTLLDLLSERRTQRDSFPKAVEELYDAALKYLAKFQILGGSSLDFARCAVNQTSTDKMFSRDLVAFKEQFLVRAFADDAHPDINGECRKLCDFVGTLSGSYFLYRDFQARNIMVKDDDLVFIDYQGGTQGPLQYDVVSLLYQASAQIPQARRERLVERYVSVASELASFDKSDFMRYFRAFIALRMMQVLSVYGKQGLGAGKVYFLDSIPLALSTLYDVINSADFPVAMPQLSGIVQKLQSSFPSPVISSAL